MRIALVILHADPARGGAERYTIDLAVGLRGRGHEVAIISTTFAAGNLPEGAVQLDAGSGTRLGRYLEFLDRLDHHLASHQYDIVHAMLPVRQCDVYHPHAGIAAEAIRSAHLKYAGPMMQVISRMANRMNLRRRRFAAIEKALLSGAHPPMVICLSDYVKRGLLAHYPMDDSRLATLFNATDLKRFDPAARPDAGKDIRNRFGIDARCVVALMIAQDFHRKGLLEAITALAKINDQRLVLLVVGKEDASPYQKLATLRGISDRVFFAGKTDDPYAFYRAADLFVLPTRHDPCSLVVLEALAMGVPVISTVFNGACEVMENGRHGYVLDDPADCITLADRLRKMLDDAVRAPMASASLALRPRLAYERHLDGLVAIYERAARGNPARPPERDRGMARR